MSPGNNKDLVFTYDELVAATNNFASLIGEGGFGSVFKGKIGNEVTLYLFVFYFLLTST